MELADAESLALELMRQHGLLPRWKFKFDRAIRRFGCCNEGKRLISLSARLTELNSEYEVRDTILHEIAHANDPRYQNIKPNFGYNTSNELFGKKTEAQQLEEEQAAWDWARGTIGKLEDRGFDFGEELDPSTIDRTISAAVASYKVSEK